MGLLCYKYSWISFSALEKKIHSWFLLKRNLLCFIIHPLLIKVVRSRWLDISLVIICPFLRTSTSYRSIKMPQKNSPNIQKSWQHSWLIIHRYWCYSTIMTMFSNSVTLGIVAKVESKTCIIISEFSKKSGTRREKWSSFLSCASSEEAGNGFSILRLANRLQSLGSKTIEFIQTIASR